MQTIQCKQFDATDPMQPIWTVRQTNGHLLKTWWCWRCKNSLRNSIFCYSLFSHFPHKSPHNRIWLPQVSALHPSIKRSADDLQLQFECLHLNISLLTNFITRMRLFKHSNFWGCFGGHLRVPNRHPKTERRDYLDAVWCFEPIEVLS